jgi:hypothetical protein
MDAFIISELVKRSFQSNKKNLEHAAFIVNTPSMYDNKNKYDNKPAVNGYSNNKSNNFKAMDLSDRSDNTTIIDNSESTKISENTKVADNSDNYKVTDNTDNSATAYSSTDNSSNVVVNNIKVTNIKTNSNSPIEEEIYIEDDEEAEYVTNNKANKVSSVTFLLMLLINSYAAYLSWECNSNKGYPLALKVVFSFFAFIFGTTYLLYYILFRFDDCNKFNINNL